MQLTRSGISKQEFDGLDPLLSYIEELQSKKVDVIVPEIAARKLRLPFSDTIFLLGLMEKNKKVSRAYQLFTFNELFPLGEYKSTAAIPDKVQHPDTGDFLDGDEFFIDLVFHINPNR